MRLPPADAGSRRQPADPAAHSNAALPSGRVVTADNSGCIADWAAGVLCLGAGFHAVEAVEADGTRCYWIVDANGRTRSPQRLPAHELLGPLPDAVTARLASTMLRCGRPTHAGSPCRTPVARLGLACSNHRSSPAKSSRDTA